MLRFMDTSLWSPGAKILASEDVRIVKMDMDMETFEITAVSNAKAVEKLEIEEGMLGSMARAIDSVCFPDGGGCKPGNYTGTQCAWEIEAPTGQNAMVTFQFLDLEPDVDFIYVYEITDLDTSKETFDQIMTGVRPDRTPLAIFTGPVTHNFIRN